MSQCLIWRVKAKVGHFSHSVLCFINTSVFTRDVMMVSLMNREVCVIHAILTYNRNKQPVKSAVLSYDSYISNFGQVRSNQPKVFTLQCNPFHSLPFLSILSSLGDWVRVYPG